MFDLSGAHVETIESLQLADESVQVPLGMPNRSIGGGDILDRLDVVDVSAGGMGALADRSFYPGQRVVLSLPRTQEGKKRSIHATIVRCRQKSQGFHIGMRFDASVISSWANSESMSLAA